MKIKTKKEPLKFLDENNNCKWKELGFVTFG
jgi:hypothetical protein